MDMTPRMVKNFHVSNKHYQGYSEVWVVQVTYVGGGARQRFEGTMEEVQAYMLRTMVKTGQPASLSPASQQPAQCMRGPARVSPGPGRNGLMNITAESTHRRPQRGGEPADAAEPRRQALPYLEPRSPRQGQDPQRAPHAPRHATGTCQLRKLLVS